MRTISDRPTRNGGWLHPLEIENRRRFIPTAITAPQAPQIPKGSPDVLDRVFRALLADLPLSPGHMRDLKGPQRQLTEEQIQRHGYRSLPSGRRTELARKLVDRFGERLCATIPGLYQEHNGRSTYWALSGAPGLLVPVRNVQGQVYGMQIRVDEGGRYRWLSSPKEKGPSSGVPAHVARPRELKDPTTVMVTEGPIKANIAADLLGMVVVGVAGVNNWRAGGVLEILQELSNED